MSGPEARAREIWQKIAHDETFYQKAQACKGQLLVPSWRGALEQLIELEPLTKNYRVFSVDGSQIYPDRHQGISCYLINIGSVALSYGLGGKGAVLESQPFLYAQETDIDDFGVNDELVNCRRQELELIHGLELCKKQGTKDAPFLFFVDGSLIFWHLQGKEVEVKNYFLRSYLQTLEQFYQQDIPLAGYISLPHSKELVNLLRLALCNFNTAECPEFALFDALYDSSVASFFLKPGTRSGVFENQSPITVVYPKHLKPHFFYLHTGTEIARMEIPAWLAHDDARIDLLARMALDQAHKGQGYPVALAEAHEQAVVKGVDRDFFYQALAKTGLQRSKNISISQKSFKKRSVSF